MKSTSLRQYGFVPGGETCAATGKKTWTSRADAKKIARRANPGERMNAFRCDHCSGWHLGHLPRGIAQGAYGRDDLRKRAHD